MSGVERVLAWLATMQARRPLLPLAAAGLLTVVGLLLAMRLELRTQFDQLLPETQPSVIELRRVVARTSGLSNVFVVLEGDDAAQLRRFGDALVPKLRAIGPPFIGSADSGVQAARAFLIARAGLFAERKQLEALKADIDERWEYEVAKAVSADLSDPPPPLSVETMKKRFLSNQGDQAAEERYPDGYYQASNGKALVVVARSASAAGDLDRSRETLKRVQAAVAEVQALPGMAGVRVGYAGDLVTGLFEYGAIKDDLVSVGLLGVAMVLTVVLLYAMRLRALLAMGVSVITGLAWTFGVTRLAIGHLNVATGFLVSIVAGNGINSGIILMARYFEERRAGHDVEEAIAIAHRETWVATLSAAIAAAAAYGSLAVTDFRGFKHFALIGAAGMVLCWIATYVVAPSVLSLVDRVRPFASDRTSWFGRLRDTGTRYDLPFTYAVPRATRALAISGVLFALLGSVLMVRYVRSDPMEYDMRKLQNDLGGSSEIYRVSTLARDVLGANTESGMVVLVDRLDQVEPLKRALEARRAAAPANEKPFEAVHALQDFVPKDPSKEKIEILLAIREKLTKAHAKGFIGDADWKKLEPFLPAENLAPYGLADLPEDLARPFTEKDGTRGRLVFVEPTAGKNDNDLHYLLAWADSFRETKLPNGEVILGSGRAVIFADMLRAVVADIPKAVVSSLLLTIAAIAITFRKPRPVLIVLGALGIGVAWLGAFLFVSKVRINFLDFIALPITFGIGADYAVNVMQRHARGDDVMTTVRSTGGAVVLCSLTTILGYLALLRSLNQAVRSLGLIAVVGEIACLLAAVLVLPAMLLWMERRKTATRASS